MHLTLMSQKLVYIRLIQTVSPNERLKGRFPARFGDLKAVVRVNADTALARQGMSLE